MRSTRLSRLPYFLHQLIIWGLAAALGYWLFLLAFDSMTEPGSAAEAVGIVVEYCLIVLLVIGVQLYHLLTVLFRLNDLGRPWWQAFLLFVPFVNIYMAIVLFFFAGKGVEAVEMDYADELGYVEQGEGHYVLTACAIAGLVALVAFPTLAVKDVLDLAIQAENRVVAASLTNPKFAQPTATPRLVPTQTQRPVLCDEGRNKEELDQYLRAGNPQRALSRFQAMEAKCGLGISLRWSAFAAYKDLGDFKAAFRIIDSLIEYDPEDRDYWAWRGQLQERLGNWREAAADYEQTLKLEPRLKGIPLNLTGVYERMNNPCQAHATLVRYMAHYVELKDVSEIVAKLARLESSCAPSGRPVGPARGHLHGEVRFFVSYHSLNDYDMVRHG